MMDEAIAWHLGLEEAGAEEWRTFVAWLEADPAHQAAYDALTLAEADMADVMATMPAPAPAQPSVLRPVVRTNINKWVKRTSWGGGMVAAAAAAWLAVLPFMGASTDLYSVSTQPGMKHLIQLADGTRIRMNGDSAVTLDRKNPRFAELAHGEAMFDVVHHADRPFEVKVAGVTLRDVGTSFDVRRDEASLQVAVAEGSVLFQPGHEAVALTPGMALTVANGSNHVELRHVQATSVGGWSQGRLEYRGVPLDDVVGDVSRSTGAKVRITGNLGSQPFTGTLRIDRAPDAVMRSLSALIDAQLKRDGPEWVISPKSPGAS
jgi:transmembrane sensor